MRDRYAASSRLRARVRPVNCALRLRTRLDAYVRTLVASRTALGTESCAGARLRRGGFVLKRHHAGRVVSGAAVVLSLLLLSACNLYGGPIFNGGGGGTTLLNDQFNGSALDTNLWTAMNRPGDASNSEVGCYKPSNVTETSGSLVIRTINDTSCNGFAYTSGMIQTTNFHFTYGTVEYRAKFAGGNGTWPAISMLGANCQASNIISADNVAPCNWPQTGSDEIDITEIKNAQLTTVNQGYFAAGGNQGFCTPTTDDVSANWHTYTLVWAPNSLTWKIDGITTCTKTNSVPHTPMFVMINTAVGGIGGGTVNPATLPQQSTVDYLTITGD